MSQVGDKAAYHPTKSDISNDVKLFLMFDSISQDILLQIFDIIQLEGSALESQVNDWVPDRGPCQLGEEVIVIPWVVRLYVKIIHKL